MVHALAVCCSLAIGFTETEATSPSSKEMMAAYRAASTAAGRSADAHVNLALWCETNGMESERVEHLARAIALDPDHATARGLLGQVAHDGRWRRPEAVADREAADAPRSALLNDYRARRTATPNTGQSQWELALWCDTHGLDAEALAHFAAVTRLEPGRPVDHRAEAWKRLGARRYKGQWLTADEADAAKAEDEAQEKADRDWTPRLAKLKARLDRPRERDIVDRELSAVADPRAVPAVWEVLGKGREADQVRATQVLGQIDGPASSRALALLAVTGSTIEVRRRAAESLAHRDADLCAEWLIGLLKPPLKYEVQERGTRTGMNFTLRVEGESAIRERTYVAEANFVPGPGFHGRIWTAEDGLPAAVAGAKLRPVLNNPSRFHAGSRECAQDLEEDFARKRGELFAALAESKDSASRHLAADLAEVEGYNGFVRGDNTRYVLPALEAVTGRSFGEDKEAWKAWWIDRRGYRYVTPPKPVVTFSDVVDESRYVSVQSCFAAGTPVATRNGLRAIETIRVGDQVLSRDDGTGALSYQPVVAVQHNPPDKTLRLKIGAEEIVATGYHRFWRPGLGWVMARELKVGQTIRTRDGLATVEAIAEAPVQPVFNLDVARTRSYFVGQSGAFVHDNSPPSAELRPFDAVDLKAVASR